MIARAPYALAAYLVITLIVTWPLAADLGRDVAWDLGDSLLNMWILSWGAEQFRALLQGDVSRLSSFFDANIFHPAPLTLAYSEHLVPQALQFLPIYLASDNPILGYNLLFLSTYVLSGLGMYLFVRELTGNATAAFVAGLVFAFAPYRIAQSPHMQILSSQWMPFALYGLRRFFATRRLLPLAGATLALVAQALSSGYYLLYFTPFTAVYALWEVWQRRLWRDAAIWLRLAAAAIVTTAVIAPFVLPYAEVRARAGASRPIAEITRFSADVYAYGTASEHQRFWGDVLRTFRRPEGELFPGFVTLILAAIALLGRPPRMRALHYLLAVIAAIHFAAAIATLLLRRIVLDLWLFTIQMSDVTQLLLRAAVAFAILLAVSPPARAGTAAFMRGPGFFLTALLLAVWLSFGPSPQALGRPLDIVAPYRLLLEHVPGFEGLRVPARFAMVAVLMLAVLAGYGTQALTRLRHHRGLVALAAILVVLEGTAAPFQVNLATPPRDYAMPEPRVYRPGRAPLVYREFAAQAPDGVLVELPLDAAEYDLRATFYSTVHWRPVLNGYSGFFPPHYGLLQLSLNQLPRHPALSLQAMREGGATHVIVHEAAFRGEEGPLTSAALRALGAIELVRDGADILFVLPR